MASHTKALSLYRQIIRVGKGWSVPEESKYIIEEARTLFHQNKNIKDEQIIQNKLFEAQSRLELGVHYKIPYPRHFNAPPASFPEHLHKQQIKAPYMDSYNPK